MFPGMTKRRLKANAVPTIFANLQFSLEQQATSEVSTLFTTINSTCVPFISDIASVSSTCVPFISDIASVSSTCVPIIIDTTTVSSTCVPFISENAADKSGNISAVHTYSLMSSSNFQSSLKGASESPSKILLKRKNCDLSIQLKNKNKKIKMLQERNRRQYSKITKMESLFQKLKEDNFLNNEAFLAMSNNFSGFPIDLFTHLKKNASAALCGRRYSQAMRQFALTLYFYSPKAYNFVRSQLCLPHPSMLREWSSSVNCEPGFFKDVIQRLCDEANRDPLLKDCALMVDGMHIRKQTIFDNATQSYVGFVDYGGPIIDDSEKMAGEALVFMIVGLTGKWKCPIGYFLIDGITADVLFKLVSSALEMLALGGLNCLTLTCDGTAANIECLRLLGCKVGKTLNDINSTFPHPSVPGMHVHAILDSCHMLKLARNALATLGILHSDSGDIKWDYILSLIKIQEDEGFSLANKITSKHKNWHLMKMKVKLAAQTLSASVSDAIAFLRDVMKLPQFKGSEATCEFISFIDRIFDLTNGRNPFERGFKAPLSLGNKGQWYQTISETCTYLSQLRCPNDIPLLCHSRKTFALGLILTSQSILAVASHLLFRENLPFHYILPYKMSQDHVELLFSCIRARGGRNNNPNVLELKYALRAILLHNRIRASSQANCLILDEAGHGSLFEIKSPSRKSPVIEVDEGVAACQALLEDEALSAVSSQLDDIKLSDIKHYVLGYIGGFIVRKLKSKLHCSLCYEALVKKELPDSTSPDHLYALQSGASYSRFTKFINRGGLILPSDGVYSIIECAEKCFQLLVLCGDSKISKEKLLLNKIAIATSQKLCSSTLFPTLEDHFGDVELGIDDVHKTQLLKAIAKTYARVRLLTYSQRHTLEIVHAKKPSIRHRNLKLTLFSHM